MSESETFTIWKQFSQPERESKVENLTENIQSII